MNNIIIENKLAIKTFYMVLQKKVLRFSHINKDLFHNIVMQARYTY